MKLCKISAAITIALCANAANASSISAADIGTKLTAAGSSVAASGNIPAFEGSSLLPGTDPDKSRLSTWKHKDEKPLFTIDSSNYQTYADRLSPGQAAIFKSDKDYKMAVYPTHRTCALPDFAVQNTKKNIGFAKLTSDGNGIEQGVFPGVPFPGTNNGLEAIWNHLMRYTGVGVEGSVRSVVSPRRGSTGFIDTASTLTLYMPLNAKGEHPANEAKGIYQNGFTKFVEPTALAGQALVTKNQYQNDAESYYYFPGQRRVRRMPSYSYDAPILGFENQIMVDASFTFNGNPDRFDWKLTGEKDIFVPYNSFKMYDPTIPQDGVLGQTSLNADARRYELHKVYVVEATVKSGMRHSAPKRTFYLDSDTYLALVADDYDDQGKLWKVRESYPMPVAELEGACASLPYVQYDLNSGRYVADMIIAGNPSGKGFRWYLESNANKFRSDFYTQDNLRAMSER